MCSTLKAGARVAAWGPELAGREDHPSAGVSAGAGTMAGREPPNWAHAAAMRWPALLLAWQAGRQGMTAQRAQRGALTPWHASHGTPSIGAAPPGWRGRSTGEPPGSRRPLQPLLGPPLRAPFRPPAAQRQLRQRQRWRRPPRQGWWGWRRGRHLPALPAMLAPLPAAAAAGRRPLHPWPPHPPALHPRPQSTARLSPPERACGWQPPPRTLPPQPCPAPAPALPTRAPEQASPPLG